METEKSIKSRKTAFKNTMLEKAAELSDERNTPYLGVLLLIMTTTFDEKLLDQQLNNLVGYLPKNELELEKDILSNYHLPSGLLQHRYTKFRILSTAISNKVDHDTTAAKNEINKILISLLKQTEYKNAVRYIMNSPFVGSNITQYLEYIQKKYPQEEENYNVWDFMRFTVLFVYLQGQKLNDRFEKLINAKGNEDEPKLIMDLIDLEGVFERVNDWLEERLNIKLQNDQYMYNDLLSKLNDEKNRQFMSSTDRVYYFYATLCKSMFIRKDLFSVYGKQEKDRFMGLKNGKVLAADFISLLPVYAIEAEFGSESSLVQGSRIFAYEYSFSQTILAKYNIDIELLLNSTYISFDDLERVMYSYIISSKEQIEKSPFKATLLPVDDAEELMEYDELDEDIAIRGATVAVVDGVIQVCLARHLSTTTERLNALFYDGGKLVSQGDVEIKGMHELKKEKEALQLEVDQLKQQLAAQEKESASVKDSFENKEQLYKERIDKLQNETIHLSNELEEIQLKLEEKEKNIENSITGEIETIENTTVEEIDYIQKVKGLKIAVIGGHDNYHTLIRDGISEDVLFIAPREYHKPLNQLDNKDVIMIIASFNNHSQYYRVRNYLDNRGLKDKILMVNSQSGPKMFAKNVWEFYTQKIK